MKRLYVSGPMSGIEHHNFPAFFDASDVLKKLGYDPINPAAFYPKRAYEWAGWKVAHEWAVANPEKWEAYIRKDISLLLKADAIVLLDGWWNSKGACLEIVMAVCLGLPVYEFLGDGIAYAESDYIYSSALTHLQRCGLEGVPLTADGFAEYL